MKVNREQFLAHLKIAASVAAQRTPLEILQSVKVVIADGSYKITANNTETQVTQTGQCEGDNAVFMLPAKRATELVGKLNGEAVEIIATNSGVEVHSGKSKSVLATPDPQDFPEMSVPEAKMEFTISSLEFRTAASRTVFATDTESTRFAIGGVAFDATDGMLTLVATDSRRMAIVETSAKADCENVFVAATSFLDACSKAFVAGDVTVHTNLSIIHATDGNTSITGRLIEGRFPKWRDVIPKYENGVEFDADQLRQACGVVAVTTNEESRGVKFSLDGEMLALESKAADVGNARTEIPVTGSGNTEFIIDTMMLVPFLQKVSGQAPTMNYIDADSPVLFSIDGYKLIVMPIAKG